MERELKRMFEIKEIEMTVPPTLSPELRNRVGRQRMVIGGLVAAAALVLVVGGFAGARSLSSDGKNPMNPAEDPPSSSEAIPCVPPESDDHAGSRCLFGGEVRFQITAGWAEQFASRVTSAMRMAPETLLLYDNAAGTAPMASLRVIANPAPLRALPGHQEFCPRPEGGGDVAPADGLKAAIQGHVGLDSTAPLIEELAGVGAIRFDVTPASGAYTCGGLARGEAGRGVPVLTGTRDTSFGPSTVQVLPEGMRMRLYLLDLPPGRAQTLAIAVVAAERDFDTAVAAAKALLDTIEFHEASPGTTVWSPVHDRGSAVDVSPEGRWNDAADAPVDWVDVERVHFKNAGQARWSFELKADPPRAARLEPGRLIAYGVVLDTNADGEADYEIGIDNDAAERGDFHVWVSDLATGEIEERVGPPYGFPIEFGHPDEADIGGLFFTFLSGTAPQDLTRTVRFYAWAAELRDGEIVASDFVPDTGWAAQL